jgi:hypothetical protein
LPPRAGSFSGGGFRKNSPIRFLSGICEIVKKNHIQKKPKKGLGRNHPCLRSVEIAGEQFPAMLPGVSPDEAANARGPIVIPTILSGFLQSRSKI